MTDKRPSFQWYPKDYLSDENVALMTLEEEGAYRRLMDFCWLQGSIPGDMESLGKLCKNVDPERMAVLWDAISKCFKRRGERYVHPRLEIERRKQDSFKKSKSRAGKAGAEARWQKEENGSAIDSPLAKNGSSSSSASASSSSTPKNPTPPPPAFVRDFEEFWTAYPLKVGRKAALKAYQARRRAGVGALEITEGLGRYLKWSRATDTKLKHPSTFVGPDEWWAEPWTIPPTRPKGGNGKGELVLDPKFKGDFTPVIEERTREPPAKTRGNLGEAISKIMETEPER